MIKCTINKEGDYIYYITLHSFIAFHETIAIKLFV